MNAQTVQDNVNKYRYGVKIGNYNEETFGRDAFDRQVNQQWTLPKSTTHDSFGLTNTIHNQTYNIPSEEQKEFQTQVIFNHKGIENHILEGHGPKQSDFERREFGSTYDLSYNQKIKPQTQIYSKFEPDQTLSAKPYHNDCVYEKAHQRNIPEMGDKAILKEDKKYIHYHEFTKGFDATNQKIPFRK